MKTVDPRLKSKWRAQRFYEELERLLKRHRPDQYAPAMASFVADLSDKPAKWRIYPLHHVVHSIEANCAYYKSPRAEPLTEHHINAIANHYKSYYDPYLKYTLTEARSLELFALAMARQQFELQRRPGLNDLARCLLLYVEGAPLPKIEVQFVSQYGLTLYQWVYMCLAAYTVVTTERASVIRPENFIGSEVQSIPRDAVRPFLSLASRTPDEIAQRYREARKEIAEYLHIFIRSTFFEHPLIAFPGDAFVVVHPAMIFQLASVGLYRLCQSIDSEIFLAELGISFERYVGKILSQLESVIRIWTEKEVQNESQGQSCDYVIEFEDCLLLVECKATRYSSRLLTENAIAGDNSTGKIANAYDQVLATAMRINAGSLTKLFSVGARPLYGLVVTYGEIAFADSQWYSESFVLPRMTTEIKEKANWFAPLARPVQVLPISLFEAFLIVLRDPSQSPATLITNKLADPAGSDWAAFLFSLDVNAEQSELPILTNAYTRFFGTIVNRPG